MQLWDNVSQISIPHTPVLVHGNPSLCMSDIDDLRRHVFDNESSETVIGGGNSLVGECEVYIYMYIFYIYLYMYIHMVFRPRQLVTQVRTEAKFNFSQWRDDAGTKLDKKLQKRDRIHLPRIRVILRSSRLYQNRSVDDHLPSFSSRYSAKIGNGFSVPTTLSSLW